MIASDLDAKIAAATDGAAIGRMLDWAGIEPAKVADLAKEHGWLEAKTTPDLLQRIRAHCRFRIAERVLAGEIAL